MDSSTSGLMGVEHGQGCLLSGLPMMLVFLLVVSPVSSAHVFSLKPGESLRLYLTTSDPVEVYFKGNDAENILISAVGRGEALFHSEYKTRVSVSDKTLVLNGVIPSDSGVYTVREKKTNETIIVCNVRVSVLNGVIPSDSGVYTVREKKTKETISVYNISVSVNDIGRMVFTNLMWLLVALTFGIEFLGNLYFLWNWAMREDGDRVD